MTANHILQHVILLLVYKVKTSMPLIKTVWRFHEPLLITLFVLVAYQYRFYISWTIWSRLRHLSNFAGGGWEDVYVSLLWYLLLMFIFVILCTLGYPTPLWGPQYIFKKTRKGMAKNVKNGIRIFGTAWRLNWRSIGSLPNYPPTRSCDWRVNLLHAT